VEQGHEPESDRERRARPADQSRGQPRADRQQGQHDDRRAITRATATERQPQPESQDEYGGRGARPTEPASASGGPRQAARRYGDHRYDQCVGWNNTSSMGFVEPTTSRFTSSTVGNITNAAKA